MKNIKWSFVTIFYGIYVGSYSLGKYVSEDPAFLVPLMLSLPLVFLLWSFMAFGYQVIKSSLAYWYKCVVIFLAIVFSYVSYTAPYGFYEPEDEILLFENLSLAVGVTLIVLGVVLYFFRK